MRWPAFSPVEKKGQDWYTKGIKPMRSVSSDDREEQHQIIDLQLRMVLLAALTLGMRVSGGPDAWSEIDGSS